MARRSGRRPAPGFGSNLGGGTNHQAFRWTQDTGTVGLGFLLGGGPSSWAYAVSADGTTVVGNSSLPSGVEAFRWTEAEGMIGLGHLPDTEYSYAYAVSADGSVIVGNSTGTAGEEPFVWDVDHGMRSLRDVLENDYGLDLGDWYFAQGARAISADGTMIAGQGSANNYWDAWIARIVPVTDTCPGDLDYDGDVDLSDLAALLAHHGEACP